jgi:uncharacterized damage-inducible protein DinB
MRRTIWCWMAAAAVCVAQDFSPKMPSGVPEIGGTVEMRAPLRYIDVKTGDGAAAQPGQEYTVHYTGWLRDGTKFDSSVDRGEPFKFVQGRRMVISGWEMGFEGMKVGGKRRLFLPYQLAYGEKGRGKIPPKAELVFDVELLGVKDVTPPAPAADLLFTLEGIESQVMQLARAVPEEKYGWRPSQGVRSFKETFLHIVNGNSLLQHIADDLKGEALNKEIEANAKAESEPLTKAQVIEKLTASFAEVRKTMTDVSAGSLQREIDFFGRKTTARGIYTILDTHVSEHLGQLIAYCRVNGIAPRP